MTEQVFDVWWEGPYDPYKEGSLNEVNANCVLYMICGTHGLYGRNVPLYLGMTSRSIQKRLAEHDSWLMYEPDEVKIYTAQIGKFISWEHNIDPDLEYAPLPELTIAAVESLLILAHQPVYNSRSRQTASAAIGHIRIFNTGYRTTLYPEISSLFWVGDPAAPGRRQPDDGVPKAKR
jgi:hypothetical protein